jgi:hypothetical protein
MSAGVHQAVELARSRGFVISSDSPAMDGNDPLEFEALARRLERIIVASRESAPFTVSVEGGWGVGKSTLMRRLERRLQTKPSEKEAPLAKTVWFNAWTAPETRVLEGLVRSVLDELDKNALRRLARKKNLVRGVGLGVSIVAGFFHLGTVVDRIWEQVSVDPKQRNKLNEFVREAMTNWLAKTSTKGKLIVVFVDDLDRCSPAAVIQVFEAMKLYLDAPGFVFVLGWDTEQVLNAVAVNRGGGEDRLPQRYIEKIVQLGFRIPRPSDHQLLQLADTLCDAAGLTEQVLAREHRQLLINTTEGNPRQLKRFLNRFILLRDIVGEATDPAAVIQYMVLQASYDNFFSLLANVPGDEDADNPLFEFTDYASARQALGRGNLDKVSEILNARGYGEGPDVEVRFKSFEESIWSAYRLLATDRQFSDLVLGMSDDAKREVRRLARSDEVQIADSAAAAGSAKAAPPYPAEPTAAVVPGTTVLWIDDEPNTNDHALLPPGVSLVVATSTDEALRILRSEHAPIALLISDIGRGPERNAGIDGLRAIRDQGLYEGPAAFYTLRPTTGQVNAASELRAEVTSSSDELRSIMSRYLPTTQPYAQQSSSAAAS